MICQQQHTDKKLEKMAYKDQYAKDKKKGRRLQDHV